MKRQAPVPRRKAPLASVVRAGALALAVCAATPLLWPDLARTATVVQEPMPDPARKEAMPGTARPDDGAPKPRVIYSSEGSDSSPPSPGTPLRMGKKPARAGQSLYLDLLADGWDRLNAGQFPLALDRFGKAAESRDPEVSREALMGKGYALWRLGREKQAEETFKGLVDQGYRVPEILPNLLFLLHKRGGPKAVEPYLGLLPEGDREMWRK